MSGDIVWQDRDVRFDINSLSMTLISGERVLQMFNSVEDTKGNCGDKGCLMVTNLRLMWHSIRMPKVNLTIGLKCIMSAQPKIIQSKIQGLRESLMILTSTSERKFEFIFTNLAANDSSLYTCVSSVHRAYDSTKMYRELRLRSSLLNETRLKTLPNEEIFREIHGTYNLSNDQGNIGVMIITNIRVIWYALSNSIYNVSIPYFQVKILRLKESKFGLAIVFDISNQGGGYMLGFRVDPMDKLKEAFRETRKLMKAYLHNPIFGVESQSCLDDKQEVPPQPKPGELKSLEKLSDNIDQSEQQSDAFTMYCIDSARVDKRECEYNETLGLLIEKLPEGYSLEDLWDVMK